MGGVSQSVAAGKAAAGSYKYRHSRCGMSRCVTGQGPASVHPLREASQAPELR
jgi:hypothetical protein